jgi:hypothetical protein
MQGHIQSSLRRGIIFAFVPWRRSSLQVPFTSGPSRNASHAPSRELTTRRSFDDAFSQSYHPGSPGRSRCGCSDTLMARKGRKEGKGGPFDNKPHTWSRQVKQGAMKLSRRGSGQLPQGSRPPPGGLGMGAGWPAASGSRGRPLPLRAGVAIRGVGLCAPSSLPHCAAVLRCFSESLRNRAENAVGYTIAPLYRAQWEPTQRLRSVGTMTAAA